MKLPALGMGAMRLPVSQGKDSQVDVEAVRTMVHCAMEHGVNYFDTGWDYHGGRSEVVLGQCLKEFPRESYYLADKYPGYNLANMDKTEEIFAAQLERCQVDYFDFYLFHNVCELNIEQYLDPKFGILDFLLRKKAEGRICHLGFSSHGRYDVLKRFLDAYGAEMEFCQLQLNYMDWHFQQGKEKMELLRSQNIPVWVMEPLRGGTLAALAPEFEAKLKMLRPEETVPGWAFRYLQSIPGVSVILSGMSNLRQLEENIRTFETDRPLCKKETEVLEEIADEMVKGIALPCTACRYCTSHCPKKLDIPTLLEFYNEDRSTKGGFIAPMALSSFPDDKLPGACIGCRSCEAVCPQQIKISDALREFAEKLDVEAWRLH